MTESFIPSLEILPLLFEASFDKAMVGMALIDPKGVVLRANERYCQILGYASREIVGKNYRLYSSEEDCRGDEETVRQFEAKERTEFRMVKTYIRKDRIPVDCELYSRPIFVDGKLAYFLSQIDPVPIIGKPPSDPEIKMVVKGFRWLFFQNWKWTWPILVSLGTGIGFHFRTIFQLEAEVDSKNLIISYQKEQIEDLRKQLLRKKSL